MSVIFHHISSIGHHFFIAEKGWGWKYPTEGWNYNTNQYLLYSLVCRNSLPTAQQTSLNRAAQSKNWNRSISTTPLICARRGAQWEGDAPRTLTYVGREPSLEYLKAPPHYYSSLRTSSRGCAACGVFLWVLKLGFSSPHSEVLPAQLPWLACMN